MTLAATARRAAFGAPPVRTAASGEEGALPAPAGVQPSERQIDESNPENSVSPLFRGTDRSVVYQTTDRFILIHSRLSVIETAPSNLLGSLFRGSLLAHSRKIIGVFHESGPLSSPAALPEALCRKIGSERNIIRASNAGSKEREILDGVRQKQKNEEEFKVES